MSKSKTPPKALARPLPGETRRPPASPIYKGFEQTIEALNDYVHVSKAALETAHIEVSPRHKKLSPHLRNADVQNWLHRVAIVYAVSAYEVFLKELITETLLARRILDEHRIELVLVLNTLNEQSTIKEVWADEQARKAVSSRHEERAAKVRTALGISHDEMTQASAPDWDLDLVKIACLVRNCIVHDDGKADSRVIKANQSKILPFVLGKPIPLDEPLLWKLVGALKDHARALDVMVSWQDNVAARQVHKAKRSPRG